MISESLLVAFDISPMRQVNPKVFEEGGVKCPISVYKEYKRHRPVDTPTNESRFYLRPLGKANGDI
jgi:hypothetical protein